MTYLELLERLKTMEPEHLDQEVLIGSINRTSPTAYQKLTKIYHADAEGNAPIAQAEDVNVVDVEVKLVMRLLLPDGTDGEDGFKIGTDYLTEQLDEYGFENSGISDIQILHFYVLPELAVFSKKA